VFMAETLELKDIANKLSDLSAAFTAAAKLFDLDSKRATLREKEAVSGSGDFWNDAQKAQVHLKELNDLKKGVELLDTAKTEIDDFKVHFELARDAGWRYRAVEASPVLIEELRRKGLEVVEAWAPPIPMPDASHDVVYADQVLEHMPGIDRARELVAEARRVLRPGGALFVVVPDYLKERTFFWDVDYTHNFVTTERRVRQLLHDGGFTIAQVVHSIGAATGLKRDVLAFGAVFANLPGLDTLARLAGASELLFKVRKNLFATLEFVARKPAG